MDASELESDVWLYKASAELLAELTSKIPALVTKPGVGTDIRKWVLSSKVYEVNNTVDRFQEWPQLLDPVLASLVQQLVSAFLRYCVKYPREYLRRSNDDGEAVPLPRAISMILYTFCKVRGQKVIIRLLNNEPKYVEPMLSCFQIWEGHCSGVEDFGESTSMRWEERYMMLLWLSHLMLAPFELTSISAFSFEQDRYEKFASICPQLPAVAVSILGLALNHLQESSKAREAANTLVVRLALRADMQKCDLPNAVVRWSTKQIAGADENALVSAYHHIGLLNLLFGLVSSASDTESATFLHSVMGAAQLLATSEEEFHKVIRDQAPVRKLIIKIMRSSIIHALALVKTHPQLLPGIDLDSHLEEIIQILLDLLGDKDTPVRLTASKALAFITLKLDSGMATEIIDAVIGVMNENILLQHFDTGELIAVTDFPPDIARQYKKNVDAVDPHKWHGAMLTLGHLLFRRAPPLNQLSQIIEALLVGLEFEQRSNVGTSVGVGVRDAACFGIWSLARKYSTAELSEVPVTASMLATKHQNIGSYKGSVVQITATQLVVAACLDPSGNLRRGSSAALQELIGRHPDVILEGIPIVQVVDYHAVARRSRAFQQVTVAAAELGEEYHNALWYALLGWRGARATDAESRRLAAITTRLLTLTAPSDHSLNEFLGVLKVEIARLRQINTGVTAAARHGLLLCLSESMQAIVSQDKHKFAVQSWSVISPLIEDLESIVGPISGRVTVDIENVLEAAATLIADIPGFLKLLKLREDAEFGGLVTNDWTAGVWAILNRCTTASDSNEVTSAASRANMNFAELHGSQSALVRQWLSSKGERKSDHICKGRIRSLSLLIEHSDDSAESRTMKADTVAFLCGVIMDEVSIDTKVNAMEGIGQILSSAVAMSGDALQQFTKSICIGLNDYTIDQRGDIGSGLRVSAITAALALARRKVETNAMLPVIKLIVKLAVEKLVRVRFQAWVCLKSLVHLYNLLPRASRGFNETDFRHQADISSLAYYKTMLQFLDNADLHNSVLEGLVSSAAAGSEEISRASSEALIATLFEQAVDQQRSTVSSIMNFVTSSLSAMRDQDDRIVVALIDFLTFLFEQIMTYAGVSEDVNMTAIWQVIQQSHVPASSINRLESLVRLYTAMLQVPALRILALDRLTRMLLHKWPKIRSASADGIFACTNAESIRQIDWHASAASNKQGVVALRKALGVVGPKS